LGNKDLHIAMGFKYFTSILSILQFESVVILNSMILTSKNKNNSFKTRT